MSDRRDEQRHDDDLHLLVAAYAFDALDEAELAGFETHLAGCEACRVELVGFRETAALLAAGVAETPPASLRTSVLGAVDVTRQEPPSLDAARARRATAGDGTAARRSGLRVAVAAAVLAVALLAAGLVLARQRSEIDALQEVEQVATAPDATTVELAGDGEATVRVISSGSLGQAIVVGEGLAVPAGDRTYQLWTIDAEGPRPVDVFRPDEDGTVEVVTSLDLGGAVAMGITEEPAGGSPQPTGDILLAAELTA